MNSLPQRKDFENRFLSKSDFREFLMEHSNTLGIDGWKNGKFSIRNESTPSCIVNQGWFYDYGTGKSGNIIDLIMHSRGLSDDIEGFKQACRIAEDLLNMPRTGNYSGTAQRVEEEKEYLPPMEKSVLDQYMQNKHQQRWLFDKLYAGLARYLNQEQKNKVEQKLNISLMIENVTTKNGFSFIDKRAFVPFPNENGEVNNFCGYNRESSLKAIKRKDGKPSLAGEPFLNEYGKYILWNEGDSDFVHAVGFDLCSVTAGSASIRIKRFLPKLKGRIIAFNVDNDKAGALAIARWFIEILDFNKDLDDSEKIKPLFLWWSDRSYKKMYDIVQDEVKKVFTRRLEPQLQMKVHETLKKLKIQVILNDGIIRKKGYDFTDFVGEFGEEGVNKVFKSFKIP